MVFKHSKNILFLTLLISSSAYAQSSACLANYKTPYFKWKTLPVEMYVDKKLPKVFTKALVNGIDHWNSQFKEKVFVYKGQSKGCDSPEINCLTMEKAKTYQKIAGSNDYAFAKQNYKDGLWESSDIVLNAHYKWKTPSVLGQVDPAKVVLHELGHVLGLQHHFFHLTSIMNYLPYEAGEVNLSISSFDKELIEWLYFGGKCPTDYFLASIDEQNDLSVELIKKQFSDLATINDINVLYLLSRLEKTKTPDQALAAIERAITLSSDQSNVVKAYLLNQRGDLFFLKDNYPEALKSFEESHKLWPGNYHTLTYLAQLKFLSGDKNAALVDLKQALKIKPDYLLAKELEVLIKTKN